MYCWAGHPTRLIFTFDVAIGHKNFMTLESTASCGKFELLNTIRYI